ncbi:MAG: EFR1 family ferrodoxin, partial [Candidatus Methanomethylophilaceae archaeon]
NSLQLAEAVADLTGDEVVRLEDVPDGPVDVSGCDRIGIITPVYYYNIPRIVMRLVDRMKVSEGQRFFLVFTCGTTPDHASKAAVKAFGKRGLDLTHTFEYRMPENYISLFSPPGPEKAAELMDSVPGYAAEIVSKLSIDGRCHVSRCRDALGVLTFFGPTAYDLLRRTSKFRADDGCTGCGLCTRVCPDGIIKLSGEGRPVWTAPKCEHCMGCINRCPAQAIQYGKRTVDRRRFVNDRVRL